MTSGIDCEHCRSLAACRERVRGEQAVLCEGAGGRARRIGCADLLAFLAAYPGSTAREAAEALGGSRNVVSTELCRLARRGRVLAEPLPNGSRRNGGLLIYRVAL